METQVRDQLIVEDMDQMYRDILEPLSDARIMGGDVLVLARSRVSLPVKLETTPQVPSRQIMYFAALLWHDQRLVEFKCLWSQVLEIIRLIPNSGDLCRSAPFWMSMLRDMRSCVARLGGQDAHDGYNVQEMQPPPSEILRDLASLEEDIFIAWVKEIKQEVLPTLLTYMITDPAAATHGQDVPTKLDWSALRRAGDILEYMQMLCQLFKVHKSLVDQIHHLLIQAVTDKVRLESRKREERLNNVVSMLNLISNSATLVKSFDPSSTSIPRAGSGIATGEHRVLTERSDTAPSFSQTRLDGDTLVAEEPDSEIPFCLPAPYPDSIQLPIERLLKSDAEELRLE